MKRFLLIILIFALALGGCSQEKAPVTIEPETPLKVDKPAPDITEEEIPEKAEVTEPSPEPEPEPEPEPGIKSVFTKRPLAVMLDNHIKARPQAGTGDALVLLEALAEGTITRYVALIEERTEVIGPVRSARPYYHSFIREFDAYYAHVGGSTQALTDIKLMKTKDLDALKAGSNVYWRIDWKKIPHNMYTSLEALQKDIDRKGYDVEWQNHPSYQQYDRFVPGQGAPLTDFTIWYKESSAKDVKGYHIGYVYDEAQKLYQRYVNDELHIDELTKEPIEAGNVIVQIASHKIIDDYGRRAIGTIGEGKGYYMTGGQEYELTWEKASYDAPTSYYVDGQPIIFNPGRIVIQVISPSTRIER